MKDIILMLLTVAGGLGTFLLGMKHLSEGLQAVSGPGLRKAMGWATSNRFVGIGTGVATTTLVQSSSIITVMVIGFVSSGLMNLQQAINVIIGSNIGTTTTAWIIAFAPDVKTLAMAVVALGTILYFFLSKESLRNVGLTFLGLGFIFMGLFWMSHGMEDVKKMPEVAQIFAAMDGRTFLGLLKCSLVALVVTVIIQSSSATTGIVMSLTMAGVIPFETAAGTVFGMNIGTTITAWLAALNGSTEARRTALAHSLFNIIGALILIPFYIPFIIPAAEWLFPVKEGLSPEALNVIYMKRIATIHTGFNIITMLVFLPFIPKFSRFVERVIKQKEHEKPHLSVLGNATLLSPVLACDQALLELNFMRDSNLMLFDCVRKVLTGTDEPRTREHILHREDVLDNVQREITEFLGKVMLKRLPSDVAERARRLLRMTDELESVSDETATILKVVTRLERKKQTISDVSREVILSVHDRINAYAAKVSKLIVSPRIPFDLAAIQNESKDIHDLVRASRQTQLNRIGPDDPNSALRVLGELDILNAYERVRAYYLNVAETLAGGKAAIAQ